MAHVPDTHGLSSSCFILPVGRPAWSSILATSAGRDFHGLGADSASNAHLRQVLDLGAWGDTVQSLVSVYRRRVTEEDTVSSDHWPL